MLTVLVENISKSSKNFRTSRVEIKCRHYSIQVLQMPLFTVLIGACGRWIVKTIDLSIPYLSGYKTGFLCIYNNFK